ncbi:right-handed parallel beta-helix repeat-containing protein [Streptomyces sp. H39-S7]|uniref:right-handed parallel beta-helix repeat-containing protein n=1 Tax=Streptomyces sp. H39-S7 TaxID=3004357 RepID=UPI0022AF2EA4|nr:right-handed parallel beta-helix repeat-containing protein [Streptomyces sp. H39-S7]MCZ4123713.1 right-handed parallel beta-helix repeat-containing protein [Streptomyces sp. H39-S7]
MAARRFRQLIGTAVGVAAVGLVAAPPVQAESVLLVAKGQSIQQAVDRAKPGDTVLVLPGTYQESVRITVPGITVRGSGDRTVITPPAATTGNACAAGGHGICVTGTADRKVTDVTVESLTVSGFPKNALTATDTDRLNVRFVLGRNNGQYGISVEKSTRSRLFGNRLRDNGQAGVFLANLTTGEGGALDTGGAVISGNDSSGNRIGFVARRVRNLTYENNTMTGNCAGVFVVGDEGTPRAGALSIRLNEIVANNKFCPANSRLPIIQGSGIVLTGVENTTVELNRITDNVGSSPVSGGVVLFPSFTGGPNSGNTIKDNTVLRNGPADLSDRDTGRGNTFSGNHCLVSAPKGHC